MDTISFQIGPGVQTIQPPANSPLPSITDPVIIDGTSPPYTVQQSVQLDGSNTGAGFNGLSIFASNSTVKRLTIINFSASGILLTARDGNTIVGNRIGLDVFDAAHGNRDGITVDSSSLNTIGGTTSQNQNVISGNSNNGLFLKGTAGKNLVIGNYIGVASDGYTQVPNRRDGVRIDGASQNTIGGTNTGELNVISGNLGSGIKIIGGASDNVVNGNYIGVVTKGGALLPAGNSDNGVYISLSNNNTIGGVAHTDAKGNIDQPANVISNNAQKGGTLAGVVIDGGSDNTVQGNFIGTDNKGTAGNLGPNQGTFGNMANGVAIIDTAGAAARNTIGGLANGARNVISNNAQAGVFLSGQATTTTLIVGNYIGTDYTGKGALGNGSWGVHMEAKAARNKVKNNRIAFNAKAGVDLDRTAGAGNKIADPNSIYANGALGIDLGDDGVTLNDSMGHVGPNNYQNFPVLTSASWDPTPNATTIQGYLSSTPGTSFYLEFFGNSQEDPSGYGEGEQFLGSANVTTDATGYVSFTVTFPGTYGYFASATATDPGDNTSEFSGDVGIVVIPSGGGQAPVRGAAALAASRPATGPGVPPLSEQALTAGPGSGLPSLTPGAEWAWPPAGTDAGGDGLPRSPLDRLLVEAWALARVGPENFAPTPQGTAEVGLKELDALFGDAEMDPLGAPLD